MAASSKLMIGEAERRFPVRIRIGVPPEGFGARLDALKAWLDDNCGAQGWAMTPSGLRGVLNEELFVDNSGEMFFVLGKVYPFLREIRERTNTPYLQRVEKVATRTKEARERLQMMVKRAEARRATAGAKAS